MIEINGEYGEGGGQILRTAIALSALTFKPVKIFNIRKKRPNPGLRPQHITSIKVLGELTNAEINGLQEGSLEVTFTPTKPNIKNKQFNVGTAGSISLIIQAVTPYAVSLNRNFTLEFTGGTNVNWSPPIDYLQNVFLPILNQMGFKMKITLIKRGFYPKGGGRVRVEYFKNDNLKPLNHKPNQELVKFLGISYASNLPEHVIKRQAKAAAEYLSNAVKNVPIEIRTEQPSHSLSPGSGILLYALLNEGGIIGADALGKRGLPAEKVGLRVAENLLSQVKSGASIDKNMCDMIVPYLAMIDGRSVVYAPELTQHAETNIKIIEEITGVNFIINKEPSGLVKLEVNGKHLTSLT